MLLIDPRYEPEFDRIVVSREAADSQLLEIREAADMMQ
jgi:hypothetical protein